MEYIYEKNGRRRKAIRVNCYCCEKSFLKQKRSVKRINYCSKKCSSQNRRNQQKIKCDNPNCNALFERVNNKIKSTYNFCSRKCKDESQKVENNSNYTLKHYKDGSTTYRKKAFEYYPPCCYVCKEWDKDILIVHHIDEDRNNNEIENLVILCVNDHLKVHKNKLSLLRRDKGGRAVGSGPHLQCG